MQLREGPFHKSETIRSGFALVSVNPRFDKSPRPRLVSRRPMKPSCIPSALDDLFVERGDMP